jgi:hypothetical protein
MKRSEMLSIIEEAIAPCNSCYKEHREKAAKRILDAIEEKGMLPPPEGTVEYLRKCDASGMYAYIVYPRPIKVGFTVTVKDLWEDE